MEALASIGEFIRQQREAAEVSVRELARIAGVSNPYLSQVERGLRKPSAEVLQQIAKALSMSAESLYVRAGLLDDSSTQRLTIEVIKSDPDLTDPQRAALLETYNQYISDNHAKTVA
jgi:transcriptional regulator with XRE-family HTH domain